MEMMPMLLIITMATYTLGKIAMMAVPAEGKRDKLLLRGLSCVFFFFLLESLAVLRSIPMENASVPRM